MTVLELINKLQTFNPNDEVIIEGNHGSYDRILEDHIEKEMMVDFHGHLYHASEEDEDAKIMVVIRV